MDARRTDSLEIGTGGHFHELFNAEISIGHTIDPRRISQYLPGAISLLQPVL